MVDDFTEIRILRGVANGVPVAIIHAPERLPGSTKEKPQRVDEKYFDEFAEYLKAQSLTILPGVDDRPYKKVLRIADFRNKYEGDDKTKKQKLDEELRQHIAGFRSEHPDKMEGPLSSESTDIVPPKHNGKAGSFLKFIFHKIGGMEEKKAADMENLIRSHSGTAAGLAFLAGHINLMMDAVDKGNVPRGLMTACFMASSLVIASQTGQEVDQKALDKIVNDALEKVRKAESKKSGKEIKPAKKEEEYIALQVAKKLKFMVENHPWETASMLSMGANVFSILDQSEAPRKNHLWSWAGGVASAALGFGSAAVRFFPSKGRPDLFGIEDAVEKIDDWATKNTDALKKDSLINTVTLEAARQAKPLFKFMQSNKLLVSGILGALSGVGLLVSSIFKKDWAMVRSSVCWLVAQGATALAVEKPGYSKGDEAFVSLIATKKDCPDEKDLPDKLLATLGVVSVNKTVQHNDKELTTTALKMNTQIQIDPALT